LVDSRGHDGVTSFDLFPAEAQRARGGGRTPPRYIERADAVAIGLYPCGS
jgi:hypothetical protein